MKKVAMVLLLSVLTLVVMPGMAYPKYGKNRVFYSDASRTEEVGMSVIYYGWVTCDEYGTETPYYRDLSSYYLCGN